MLFRAMVSDDGEALRVNDGGGVTARVIVALLVRLPEVPVMVTMALLDGALEAAVKVTVL